MKLYLLICLIFPATIAFGQSADDLKRLEEFRKMVDAPVVLPKNEKIRIKVTGDIVYDQSRSAQKLDVYQPAGGIAKQKMPLVIFVHGKTPFPTNPKNWGGYKSWAALMASKGYVAVTFTHSLASPGMSIEDAGADLGNALAYLKTNYSLFNIDTNRIALLAYSAGVPLLSEAFIQHQYNIKCLVAFYGFMDMTNIEMWKSENQSTLARYSLINYTKEKFPPLFIARAGKEHNKGLNESIDSFILKANSNNLGVTLINHPSGVHGFDTQNNDERSREIIESMLIFLQCNL